MTKRIVREAVKAIEANTNLKVTDVSLNKGRHWRLETDVGSLCVSVSPSNTRWLKGVVADARRLQRGIDRRRC